MNRMGVLLAVAATLGCAGPTLAQQDDVEVTLQVLDDVSDVEGVVLAVEEEPVSDAADAREAEEPRAPEAAREGTERDEALDRELDREDEGEGEVEDFDVPEVVEPEDPEAPEEPDA